MLIYGSCQAASTYAFLRSSLKHTLLFRIISPLSIKYIHSLSLSIYIQTFQCVSVYLEMSGRGQFTTIVLILFLGCVCCWFAILSVRTMPHILDLVKLERSFLLHIVILLHYYMLYLLLMMMVAMFSLRLHSNPLTMAPVT